jgi:hypothetical protein
MRFLPQGLLGRFVVVILGLIAVAFFAKLVAWILIPLVPILLVLLVLVLAGFVLVRFVFRAGI